MATIGAPLVRALMASRRNRRPRESQRDGRNGEEVREHEIKGHGKRRSALSAEGSPPVRKRQRVSLSAQPASIAAGLKAGCSGV